MIIPNISTCANILTLIPNSYIKWTTHIEQVHSAVMFCTLSKNVIKISCLVDK